MTRSAALCGVREDTRQAPALRAGRPLRGRGPCRRRRSAVSSPVCRCAGSLVPGPAAERPTGQPHHSSHGDGPSPQRDQPVWPVSPVRLEIPWTSETRGCRRRCHAGSELGSQDSADASVAPDAPLGPSRCGPRQLGGCTSAARAHAHAHGARLTQRRRVRGRAEDAAAAAAGCPIGGGGAG